MELTIFLLFVIVPVLAVILLFVNLLLAPHLPYAAKDSTYECGFEFTPDQTRTNFHVNFVKFGMFFLAFDLELAIVLPIFLMLFSNEYFGFIIVLFFLFILTIGFILEIGSGALVLTKNSNYEIQVNPEFIVDLQEK